MHTAFGSLDYTPSRHQSASRMSGVAPQPVHRSLIHYAFRKWGPFPESYVSLSKNMIKCCAAALIPPSKRRSWDLFYSISGVYGERTVDILVWVETTASIEHNQQLKLTSKPANCYMSFPLKIVNQNQSAHQINVFPNGVHIQRCSAQMWMSRHRANQFIRCSVKEDG